MRYECLHDLSARLVLCFHRLPADPSLTLEASNDVAHAGGPLALSLHEDGNEGGAKLASDEVVPVLDRNDEPRHQPLEQLFLSLFVKLRFPVVVDLDREGKRAEESDLGLRTLHEGIGERKGLWRLLQFQQAPVEGSMLFRRARLIQALNELPDTS